MSSLPDSHRPHAVNPDPRLRAVAADLEYFRTKRLEPRVLHLVRLGVISLNDLILAGRPGRDYVTADLHEDWLEPAGSGGSVRP